MSGFVSHRATFEGEMKLLESLPALVCINDAFLDKSISNGMATLGGYNLVARRDRNDGRNGGGILCFAAEVTFCEDSAEYERS